MQGSKSISTELGINISGQRVVRSRVRGSDVCHSSRVGEVVEEATFIVLAKMSPRPEQSWVHSRIRRLGSIFHSLCCKHWKGAEFPSFLDLKQLLLQSARILFPQCFQRRQPEGEEVVLIKSSYCFPGTGASRRCLLLGACLRVWQIQKQACLPSPKAQTFFHRLQTTLETHSSYSHRDRGGGPAREAQVPHGLFSVAVSLTSAHPHTHTHTQVRAHKSSFPSGVPCISYRPISDFYLSNLRTWLKTVKPWAVAPSATQWACWTGLETWLGALGGGVGGGCLGAAIPLCLGWVPWVLWPPPRCR